MPHADGAGHSDWVHTFEFPKEFSLQAISDVKQGQAGGIPSMARNEIISALYSQMIQHQQYPSPYEYKIACHRLENFPSLRDVSSISIEGIVRKPELIMLIRDGSLYSSMTYGNDNRMHG